MCILNLTWMAEQHKRMDPAAFGKANYQRNSLWGALVLLIGSASCNPNVDRTAALEQQVATLQAKVEQAYKPGLGEFMSVIQVHHEKLWFAGTHANWKLADFEVHEIMESLDDIKVYAKDRKETVMIGLLDPALDSVRVSISKEDTARFRSAYLALTNSCNSCHRATEHGFNVIKLPSGSPFGDQEFTPVK